MDEPEMAEIVRHLVNEEGCLAAIDPGIRKVLLAHGQERLCRQICEHGWIERAACAPSLQCRHCILNVREFVRALDLRMGSQDLLQQSRTGARQANNEDRVGTCAAPTRPLRKEWA